ncbi:hypothetical protein BCR44DRAFT_1431188 [Catenaria anguillulae PL171]|uniref:Uncharacterized protein n=1 Tax=Catenaria anguillulae PL171 TaxID=765915 RepID=A0A1Y2HQV2_9FUNG|nr:hypothetical protein BCR44DRAFT_1431188 [Catenaria anguillulae PL171]
MDLLVEIDNSVKVRELSTRSTIDSNLFFAVMHLAPLVADFLTAAAEHFPEQNGYSVQHACSFLNQNARTEIILNPHCNQPTSFDPSPVLEFLRFLSIPISHSIVADPLEAFQLRSELDRYGTWSNARQHLASSPNLQSLAQSLTEAICGITPAYAAVLGMPTATAFDFGLYYNAVTGDFQVLAYTPRTKVPVVFHAAKVDEDGWVAFEHVATAATVKVGASIGERPARQFTDEAFNPLHVHDLDGMLYVDLSTREQADKDYAIALAMEDAAAIEAARDAAGAPIGLTVTALSAGGDGPNMGGGYIPPAHLARAKSKKKNKDTGDAVDESKVVNGEKPTKKKFLGLFGKKKSKSAVTEE